MSLHHFAPLSHSLLHIDIANGGFDGPLAHGVDLDMGLERRDPVAMRDVNWREAVHRVFSRRRNTIARGLQRWACSIEVRLATRVVRANNLIDGSN